MAVNPSASELGPCCMCESDTNPSPDKFTSTSQALPNSRELMTKQSQILRLIKTPLLQVIGF